LGSGISKIWTSFASSYGSRDTVHAQ